MHSEQSALGRGDYVPAQDQVLIGLILTCTPSPLACFKLCNQRKGICVQVDCHGSLHSVSV